LDGGEVWWIGSCMIRWQRQCLVRLSIYVDFDMLQSCGPLRFLRHGSDLSTFKAGCCSTSYVRNASLRGFIKGGRGGRCFISCDSWQMACGTAGDRRDRKTQTSPAITVRQTRGSSSELNKHRRTRSWQSGLGSQPYCPAITKRLRHWHKLEVS
jgi:hypothetical protein